VSDRPKDEATPPATDAAEPAEEDWAAEIKRLRAARGAKLAARLAEDGDKEPPVEP
jgi:hypothetical protein